MTAVTSVRKHAVDAPVGLAQFTVAWRRTADEARGDRLATASVGLIGAVIGAAVALFASNTTAAVCVGLVTLCVTPGCALVCWLSTKERLTRALLVIAASLTWTVFLNSILAWLQVTALGVLLMATVGVGGIGSAAFLVIQLTRYLRRMPIAALVKGGYLSAWNASGGDSQSRFDTASRRFPAPMLLLMSALIAASGLLAIAVNQARTQAVGKYGLLPLLGISFLAAAVLTVGVLVVALRFIRTAWPAAVVALGLLLIEFNGTPMMIAATPLGSSAYKHFGVVDYIVHGGALSDPLDIYQQWPGFFAAAAGLVRLSGRGPMSYSNWAQLFFEALNGIVIFAIARRFSEGHRTVPYVAVLLFETANWEGTFYYSPQTMAFVLALFFQFLLLSLLEPARLRRPFLIRGWLDVPQLELQGEEQIDRLGMAARLIGLTTVFGAMIITHQLSPYMVFAGVIGLWVLGTLRRPRLVLVFALMLVIYPFLHLAAVDHNPLLTGFHLSNATGTEGFFSVSPEEALAGVLAKTIGMGFWIVTALCVLSYRRRIGMVAIPAVLAAVPLLFVVATNYDGEAIYRVFLFSSPWCAIIIARRLVPLIHVSVLGWVAVGCWALFAALGSAQAQEFGMFSMLQVPSAEISASAYFLDHSPPNAEIVTAAAENFPGRLNGRYVLHNVTQSQNDPSLDSSNELKGYGLDRTSPRALAQYVANIVGGSGYLVISPSMEKYVDYYGVYGPGTLSRLMSRLKTSDYWQVWYQNDGTIIFRAWPQGKPATRTVRRHRHSR